MDVLHLFGSKRAPTGPGAPRGMAHDREDWDFEIVPDRNVWRLDGIGAPEPSCRLPKSDEPVPAWVEALKSTALTLDHTSSDVVGAMSVTCGLSGRPSEVERLVLLVSQLSDQFSLDARVRMNERNLTVQFTRAEDDDPTQ